MTAPTPTPGGSGTQPAGSGPGPATQAPSTSAPAGGALQEDTLAALQAVMAAEHAALWAYGLVAAYDPSASTTVGTMVSSHQDVRDTTANLIVQGGSTPVGPAPAYRTPETVTNVKTALGLALTIESDCAAAWRSVIGHTDDAALRGTALSALTDCAMRMVTWRQTAGDKVVTTPFPGAPQAGD